MGRRTDLYLEIIDDKFGEDNYEYEIFVNSVKRDIKLKNKKAELEDVGGDDVIEVRAKNIVLSSKYGWMLMLFYWILSLLAGMGEQNPFGKPFDAYIKFKPKSHNITLRGNKIWDKEAFEIFGGKVDVIENYFVSTKRLRRRWLLGMVMPLDILIGFILGVCIYCATASAVGVIFGVPVAIGGLCWNFYAYRLIAALKKKK